jgi:hypothetical protein
MTEPHDHAHAAAAAAPFTPDELEQLHAADRFAGKAVVSLMVGIFATGLVLYSIILGVVLS